MKHKNVYKVAINVYYPNEETSIISAFTDVHVLAQSVEQAIKKAKPKDTKSAIYSVREVLFVASIDKE